ncbi:hypothetical protein ACGFMO_27825 [Streptomyces niveus]|uniref:hypothetical protein n=1 Tax=Streptomyces niveus TaxID=193462 RepID=UPI00370FBCA3
MPRSAPAGRAAEVLRTAALLVADDPVPAPLADRWIYVREGYYDMVPEEKPAGLVVQSDVNHHPLGEKKYFVPKANGLPRAEAEEWIPYAEPDAERGRTDQKYSAPEIFRFLADLPDDPEAILDEVRAFYPANPPENPEAPDEQAFRALGLLAVQQPVLRPQGLAKTVDRSAGRAAVDRGGGRHVCGGGTAAGRHLEQGRCRGGAGPARRGARRQGPRTPLNHGHRARTPRPVGLRLRVPVRFRS